MARILSGLGRMFNTELAKALRPEHILLCLRLAKHSYILPTDFAASVGSSARRHSRVLYPLEYRRLVVRPPFRNEDGVIINHRKNHLALGDIGYSMLNYWFNEPGAPPLTNDDYQSLGDAWESMAALMDQEGLTLTDMHALALIRERDSIPIGKLSELLTEPEGTTRQRAIKLERLELIERDYLEKSRYHFNAVQTPYLAATFKALAQCQYLGG